MSTIFEDDIDKTSKAVTKFLRQTLEGEISWKIDDRKAVPGAGEYVIGKIYMTIILDKCLRIYKYKEKYYADEDNYSWSEGVKLQFTDDEGNPEWDFPYSNAVDDLYKAISFKTTNVEEFFDKWLNE